MSNCIYSPVLDGINTTVFILSIHITSNSVVYFVTANITIVSITHKDKKRATNLGHPSAAAKCLVLYYFYFVGVEGLDG